ncbi:hypothetical protein [Streptomyces pinistramenti]|uniref:hypothetical protein n=1 Tax=Streptomyces pinistramenti TaxID=2884812 RepID=UPI001D083799|nr:hypothetical protein [Streptomyces pinistramenti]MCB5905873.1 hypothetical protein [Streptomyces pinistramenti]
MALEGRLAGDGDHYALLCSYTDDLSDTPETTVLLRAVDERDPQPFRGLVEAADLAAGTHTLRESRFTRPEEATQWWDRHWSRPRTGVPIAPPPAPSPAPEPPFTPSRSR